MSGFRYAIDTGGTFTDLIVESSTGELSFFKSPTTPDDPVRGVINVLAVAAEAHGCSLENFLQQGVTLLHGTTRALNAVLSHKTARTAFLTTQGHPDVLLFREGGRENVFDFSRDFPAPYVPRALTWEVPERIGAAGEIVQELDEDRVRSIAAEIKASGAEAVAVCLLWSPVNAAHEERVGEILAESLPDLPVTLSYRLAPMLREYRRASAAAIDASLKPLMTDYLSRLEDELQAVGFAGRLLIVTSSGGVLDARSVALAPILAINSGPSMAPVAGLHYARTLLKSSTAIVADTGGTSYDVSLVRNGHIPRTRETWLGDRFFGHITGFPSVDITSIGAGGGSIAWVDEGGLLKIGPESAGADPGPACYCRGGLRPTVTDACVVLGYIDPDYFLGGKMKLDRDASVRAIATHVAEPLGLSVEAAAYSIVDLATEEMVHAIEDVTVSHGVDPASSVLVAGGGAAGLNSVKIGRRLGSKQVIFPNTGAVLSASGALLADLSSTFTAPLFTTSDNFDLDGVNRVLADLRAKCLAFIDGPGAGASRTAIKYSVEARYARQVWEIEIELPTESFAGEEDVRRLLQAFHREHETIFAVSDQDSPIETMTWNVRVDCSLHQGKLTRIGEVVAETAPKRRSVFFGPDQQYEALIRAVETIAEGEAVAGPAIIESGFTTIIIDPGASATMQADGSLLVDIPAA